MPKGIYFRSEEQRKKTSERSKATIKKTLLKYPNLTSIMGKSTQLKHPNQSSINMKRTNERLMKEDMDKYITQRRNTASKAHDELHPLWKGGVRTYYQRKARKIVEKQINRKLTPKEEIHHIDHNWKNNKPTNLHLFENKGKHQKYHHFLKSLVRKELDGMEQ